MWTARSVRPSVRQGGVLPGVMLFVFTAQATGRDVRRSEEGELVWVPLTAVHDLDWVDGDPRLLLQALEARDGGHPFFTRIG